jgi:hypothetical protein
VEASMKAFEIVLVVVCVVSTLIAGAAWLRVGQLYDQIGRTGQLSFEHEGGLSAEMLDAVRNEVREMLSVIQRGNATGRDGPRAATTPHQQPDAERDHPSGASTQ